MRCLSRRSFSLVRRLRTACSQWGRLPVSYHLESNATLRHIEANDISQRILARTSTSAVSFRTGGRHNPTNAPKPPRRLAGSRRRLPPSGPRSRTPRMGNGTRSPSPRMTESALEPLLNLSRRSALLSQSGETNLPGETPLRSLMVLLPSSS